MEQILGYALGNVDPELAEDITVKFPETHLPGWSAREVGASTDSVVAAALHASEQPWTTLLVTPWLDYGGTTSLSNALITIKKKWPNLRIAVLLGSPHPDYKDLVVKLSAYRIWNILISEDFQYEDLTSLVTEDWPWERISWFLESSTKDDPPPHYTLPGHVSTQTVTTDTMLSTSIAVVSGKGNVGKTSIVANLLLASASMTSIAIDADIHKSSLHLYFMDPDKPLPTNMHQLVSVLSSQTAVVGSGDFDYLTPKDKQEIRQYIADAIQVAPGARLVPGPSRHQPTMNNLPPGVMAELIKQAKSMARVVWVDLPADSYNDSWVEAIRSVDKVLLVTSPDRLTVIESLTVLNRLDTLKVPRNSVYLIVNRVAKGGLNPDEISHVHLKLPLLASIREDPMQWNRSMEGKKLLAQGNKGQVKFWTGLVSSIVTQKSQTKDK